MRGLAVMVLIFGPEYQPSAYRNFVVSSLNCDFKVAVYLAPTAPTELIPSNISKSCEMLDNRPVHSHRKNSSEATSRLKKKTCSCEMLPSPNTPAVIWTGLKLNEARPLAPVFFSRGERCA